jgi:uncharacterized protein YecT (DUF1311 family)
MKRIAIALGLLLLTSAAAQAQAEFEPTAAERATIACIERTAGEPELKQMANCIGLIADPCSDAPGANTFTIVACHMREQKIWDGYLNDWYGEAQSRLKDQPGAAAALKEAQRTWIQFRDAKCDYWEKLYEGGTSPRSRPATACGWRLAVAHSRCTPSLATWIISRSRLRSLAAAGLDH